MSDDREPPEADLTAIEAALGSLAPSKSRINRDRLMFEAGRASVRPSTAGRRGWVAVAASLALVASGEGVMLARRPAPEVVERIVVVREPAIPPALAVPEPAPRPTGLAFDFGSSPHDRLAGQILRYGLDGLPPSGRPGRGEPVPIASASRRVLQEELRKALNLGDPS